MLINFFPLPVFTVFLLCFGSLLFLCFKLYANFTDFSGGLLKFPGNVPLKLSKIIFIVFLGLNFILVLLALLFYKTEVLSAIPVVADNVTDTLRGGDDLGDGRSYFVDALSAWAVLFAALAAVVISLKAMSDKVSVISQQKMAAILLVLASVEGVYYSNSLFSMYFFIILSQFASYGLYKHTSVRSKNVMSLFLHHLSRIVSMVLLLAGIILLGAKYGSSLTRLIACKIEIGTYEKITFTLIFAPLLAFFLRPVSHTNDPVYRSFFIMRCQAVFYVIIRIVFSTMGASSGLEKVPLMLIAAGCLTLLVSVLMIIASDNPSKQASFLDLFAKGFLVVSAGIGYYGCFSADGLAQYGFTALECMSALWLLYLPVSSALSIASAQLEREDKDGTALYKRGGMVSLMPFVMFVIFFAVFALCGMAPFVTYPFLQLLYRCSNFVCPFLAAYLVIVNIAVFFVTLYEIATIAFGKAWTQEDKKDSPARDTEITLTTGILLLWIIILSFTPGILLRKIAAPSVEALMNTGYSVNVIEEAGK